MLLTSRMSAALFAIKHGPAPYGHSCFLPIPGSQRGQVPGGGTWIQQVPVQFIFKNIIKSIIYAPFFSSSSPSPPLTPGLQQLIVFLNTQNDPNNFLHFKVKEVSFKVTQLKCNKLIFCLTPGSLPSSFALTYKI